MRPTDQASERVLTKRERGGGYMYVSPATRDMRPTDQASERVLTKRERGFIFFQFFLCPAPLRLKGCVLLAKERERTDRSLTLCIYSSKRVYLVCIYQRECIYWYSVQ